MSKELKILFVCGNGTGTSAMTEMVTKKALKELEISAQMQHTALGEFKSRSGWADVVVLSTKFSESVNKNDYPNIKFIEIVNIMDGKGIAKRIKEILEEDSQ